MMSQPTENGDNMNQRQISPRRSSYTEEVMVETPDIVTFFVTNRLEAHGHTLPQGIARPNINTELATCIKQIGDELERNRILNDLIRQIPVTTNTAFETFSDVASQIFADGVYNWGRIVTLLYFGFKLACSVISQVPLLNMVLDWVVRFVKDKLVGWIAEQGGWKAIKQYVGDVGASTWHFLGVFLMGAGFLLWSYNRQ